jgi:dimethyladenosine transferase
MDQTNTPKLTDIGYVKSLMERHGLRFEKRYGQNFLVNSAIPRRIAEECGASPENGILEIGPGIGTLTVELAQRFAKVVAVELDRKLLPVLDETLAQYPNTSVINADVMKLDIIGSITEYFPGMSVAVCANLPYYITTPVIMKLLESGANFSSITLMVQREVAMRLCAGHDTPEYGAITAEVAWYCSVKRLFNVSPGSFIPAPKVESSVIRLTPKPPLSSEVSRETYRRVVAAAFSQRRKTLLNALSGLCEKSELSPLLHAAGIDPERRGETLSPDEFALVAKLINKKEL